MATHFPLDPSLISTILTFVAICVPNWNPTHFCSKRSSLAYLFCFGKLCPFALAGMGMLCSLESIVCGSSFCKPFVLRLIQECGALRLLQPRATRRHIPIPFFSYSYALFGTREKLKSFVFRIFRTLWQKTPGWGCPIDAKVSALEASEIVGRRPGREFCFLRGTITYNS